MDFIEFRSEEVQEILGSPPGWLVRWGTTLVLLGFSALLLVAWLVRYPDIIEAKVILTTATPPVEVVARADGRIAQLLVQDRQSVKENDLLAVLQTAADYSDVLALAIQVEAWQKEGAALLRQTAPERDLNLGELQDAYALFLQQWDRFQFGSTNRSTSIQSNIASIRQQITQLEQSIVFDQKALKRTGEQVKIAEEFYQKQKQLYEEGVSSKLDFEKERTKLADLERQRDIYDDNILRKRNEIIALKNTINNAAFGQQENSSSTSSELNASISTLRSAIEQWKNKYLLLAPITGRASLNNIAVQQYIKQGEGILTIVPPMSDKIVGRVQLPVSGSGKVQQGQKVMMKLDGYPYQEFGAIAGKVVSKSLVPKDNQYSILVEVNSSKQNYLQTTYKKEILFEQQLPGKAEIITEDRSFLERIADKTRSVFH
jgi:multidrug resistance efflux pump